MLLRCSQYMWLPWLHWNSIQFIYKHSYMHTCTHAHACIDTQTCTHLFTHTHLSDLSMIALVQFYVCNGVLICPLHQISVTECVGTWEGEDEIEYLSLSPSTLYIHVSLIISLPTSLYVSPPPNFSHLT